MSNTVSGLDNAKIDSLINAKASFEVIGLRGNFMEGIKHVERTIESKGMKCRVETDVKSSLAAGGAAGLALTAAATPVVITAGIFTLAAGLGHKLVTRNPDYLTLKYYVNFKLKVTYKK